MSFRCPECRPLTAAERERPGGLPYGESLALCAVHAPPEAEPRRRPPRSASEAIRDRLERAGALAPDGGATTEGTP